MREEIDLINSKELRNKCANHYEVLEKVKKLLLIPEMECMTTQQVAAYYGVGKEAIEAIYTRHQDELISDGMIVKKQGDFLNLQNESFHKTHDVLFQKERNKVTLTYHNGMKLTVTNRGLKVFPRRAILRVGMLLRDSEIAKEVRTQLLNIEEKTTDEIKTSDLNEEMRLALNLGMSQASGNVEAYQKAVTEMMAFKNRHIEKLKENNEILHKNNQALANGILEWSDRNKLNAGIRQLSAKTGIHFSKMWNELYKNLQYKYSICLTMRGDKPYIQHIQEDEWNNVIKTFCAMCEAYGQSPAEMFQRTTPVCQ